MTKNVVRMNQNVNGGYGNALAAGDDRFVTDFVPTFHAIASTNGQNDGGVFEMNLNDERYLPFEGAGVISEWEIKLPQENNQFDFDTISDLILHIRYTAVQGDNENFLKAARDNLETVLPATGFRLFSLKQEFGTEWYRFFNPEAATDETLSFTTKTEQLPFWVRARAANKTLRLDQVDLILESSYNGTFDLEVQFPGTAAPVPGTLAKDAAFGGLHYFEKKVAPAPVTQLLGNWMCKIKKDSANKFTQLRPDDVSNAYLLVKFSIQ
jgi:hypothetical protein